MEKRIMGYVDFGMTVDTEPDINGCMWMGIRKAFQLEKNQQFDMSEDCVRRLHEATGEFLATLDARKNEGETG